MNDNHNVVTVCHPNGTPRNYYTDTREDATEKHRMACDYYEYVEILHGTPGHYESIEQSW